MINLMKYHIKVLFAHKKLIMLSVVVSIIIIIGTCFSVTRDKDTIDTASVQMGVINEDVTQYAKMLIHYFKNNESFRSLVQVIEGSKEEIEEQFEKGELDVYLTIPKDFVENMMYIKNLPIKVKMNVEDTTKAVILKNVFESYENYVKAIEMNAVGLADIMRDSGANEKQIEKKNMDISISLIMTALGKEQFFKSESIDLYPSTPLNHYYFLSILFIFLFYGSLYMGLDMIKESGNGTLDRMKAAGVSALEIICSKIFILASFLFLIFSIPYIVILKILHLNISIAVLVFVYLSIILCGGLAVLISAVVRKKEKFIMVGNIFGFFTIIIGGGVIPLMYLPNAMVQLSKSMLNYWFIKGFLLLEQGYGTGHIYFVIMSVIICIEVIAASYLYRRNEAYHE